MTEQQQPPVRMRDLVVGVTALMAVGMLLPVVVTGLREEALGTPEEARRAWLLVALSAAWLVGTLVAGAGIFLGRRWGYVLAIVSQAPVLFPAAFLVAKGVGTGEVVAGVGSAIALLASGPGLLAAYCVYRLWSPTPSPPHLEPQSAARRALDIVLGSVAVVCGIATMILPGLDYALSRATDGFMVAPPCCAVGPLLSLAGIGIIARAPWAHLLCLVTSAFGAVFALVCAMGTLPGMELTQVYSTTLALVLIGLAVYSPAAIVERRMRE